MKIPQNSWPFVWIKKGKIILISLLTNFTICITVHSCRLQWKNGITLKGLFGFLDYKYEDVRQTNG